MESKLENKRGQLPAPALLIEPVWNRNVEPVVKDVLVSGLLIEPVWNRNIREQCGHYAIHIF